MSTFIPAYLIQGTPGYVARTRPTVEEAIGWIHDAAGVAVWAHPFWDITDDARGAGRDRPLLGRRPRRRRGRSTPPTPRSRRCSSPTAAPSSACSAPARPTTTAPTTSCSAASGPSTSTVASPNLGPIAHGTLAAPSRGGDGLCIWLTGLSGSGKSTVGRIAAGELRDRGHRVEMLDGDDVRQNICDGLGFSREDREINVRRIAFVADLLARNGVVTFVAAVSPYRRPRDDARARMGERFIEVHVRASVEACEERDVKGLYERARSGQIQAFTGVSDPYEEPLTPELELDTESESAQESAARLVELVEERLTARGEAAQPAQVARALGRGWSLGGLRRLRRHELRARLSRRPLQGAEQRQHREHSSAACRNDQAKPSRADPAVWRMISSSKPGSGSKRSRAAARVVVQRGLDHLAGQRARGSPTRPRRPRSARRRTRTCGRGGRRRTWPPAAPRRAPRRAAARC